MQHQLALYNRDCIKMMMCRGAAAAMIKMRTKRKIRGSVAKGAFR
jgi:hypothetical protein